MEGGLEKPEFKSRKRSRNARQSNCDEYATVENVDTILSSLESVKSAQMLRESKRDIDGPTSIVYGVNADIGTSLGDNLKKTISADKLQNIMSKFTGNMVGESHQIKLETSKLKYVEDKLSMFDTVSNAQEIILQPKEDTVDQIFDESHLYSVPKELRPDLIRESLYNTNATDQASSSGGPIAWNTGIAEVILPVSHHVKNVAETMAALDQHPIKRKRETAEEEMFKVLGEVRFGRRKERRNRENTYKREDDMLYDKFRKKGRR